MSQLVGGVKREYPQAERGLYHIWPVRDSNLHQTQQGNDRMIKSVEIQRPYPLGHGGRPVLFVLKYSQLPNHAVHGQAYCRQFTST